MNVLGPLVAWLALGLPTAIAFLRHGRPELAVAVLPFAGALSLLLPVVATAWVGGGLAGWPWQAPVASLLVGLGAYALLRGASPPPPSPAASPSARAATLALLVAACVFPLGVALELAQGWPGYEWDGLVIWLVRARVLAQSDVFPARLFGDPYLAQGHWDYPLLMPALLAWFARLGGLEIRQLTVPLGLFAAVFPLATAAGLTRTLRLPLAAVIALSPFVVPDLLRYHFHAYADGLLVLLATAGLAWTTAGALRADRASLVAGGLALAAAVSVKNEGVLWLGASGAGVALLSSLHAPPARRRAGALARAVLPGLAFFLLWQLTCRHLHTPATLAAQLRWDLVAERFLPLVAAFVTHVCTAANAPLLLGSLFALGLLTPGGPWQRVRLAALLLAAPLALVAGLFLVYLGTPHDLRWHVLTSLHRTVYGIVPAVIVAAVFTSALPAPARRPAAELA